MEKFLNIFRIPDLRKKLIFTGLLLWFSKDYDGKKQIDDFSIKNSLLVGFFQGLAILPGVSRSGSTIAISKIMGMDPVRAARFSFLLFIPAIVGATLLKIGDLNDTVSEVSEFSLILWEPSGFWMKFSLWSRINFALESSSARDDFRNLTRDLDRFCTILSDFDTI